MKIIFLLICMSLLLFSASINEQIHALEDATPKERVALMNHIKEQLIEMNHEECMNTIASLQEKLHAKNEQTKHTDAQNAQNISENQEDSHQSDGVRNLEHHELQEQMSTHHRVEEELHQHQRFNEQRLDEQRSENHTPQNHTEGK